MSRQKEYSSVFEKRKKTSPVALLLRQFVSRYHLPTKSGRNEENNNINLLFPPPIHVLETLKLTETNRIRWRICFSARPSSMNNLHIYTLMFYTNIPKVGMDDVYMEGRSSYLAISRSRPKTKEQGKVSLFWINFSSRPVLEIGHLHTRPHVSPFPSQIFIFSRPRGSRVDL